MAREDCAAKISRASIVAQSGLRPSRGASKLRGIFVRAFSRRFCSCRRTVKLASVLEPAHPVREQSEAVRSIDDRRPSCGLLTQCPDCSRRIEHLFWCVKFLLVGSRSMGGQVIVRIRIPCTDCSPIQRATPIGIVHSHGHSSPLVCNSIWLDRFVRPLPMERGNVQQESSLAAGQLF